PLELFGCASIPSQKFSTTRGAPPIWLDRKRAASPPGKDRQSPRLKDRPARPQLDRHHLLWQTAPARTNRLSKLPRSQLTATSRHCPARKTFGRRRTIVSVSKRARVRGRRCQ